MIALSDNCLMQRVREGDVEGLGVLFERHRARLLNFFLRFTRNRTVSEDLVQDVFLRILRYRHAFGPGSEFAAWMYGIARNVHHNHFRKREREVPLEDGRESETEPISEEPAPDEVLKQRHDLELLRHAFAQLPHPKREILRLSRLENLRYRDIARRLNCEVGAVKVRVFRASREIERAFHKLAAET